MKVVLIVLVVAMMLATLGVLFAGLLGLTRSGHDPYRWHIRRGSFNALR